MSALLAGGTPDADLFSHNELLINASCDRIWSHIIDASKWPEWYPNAKEIKIVAPRADSMTTCACARARAREIVEEFPPTGVDDR